MNDETNYDSTSGPVEAPLQELMDELALELGRMHIQVISQRIATKKIIERQKRQRQTEEKQ